MCINYRKSSWIQYALDRERFNRRIKNLECLLCVNLNKMSDRIKEISLCAMLFVHLEFKV